MFFGIQGLIKLFSMEKHRIITFMEKTATAKSVKLVTIQCQKKKKSCLGDNFFKQLISVF